VVRAASERLGPSLAAVTTTVAALLPFVVFGDLPGNELTRPTAAVMLGGIVTSALLSGLLLPTVCAALGPKAPIPPEEPADILDLRSLEREMPASP
jgi:Cu/Ag efflux pump CusA